MVDDAFDGVLRISTPDQTADLVKTRLSEIVCQVPLSPKDLNDGDQTDEIRQKLKNSLRQSFSKFASKSA